jgi:hypothetical protein
MKQCPVCNEVFDPLKAFCDMDGSQLVDPSQVNSSNKTSSAWITGAIGGFIGVILCLLLYIGFLAPSQKDAQQQERPTQTAETVKTNHVAIAPSNNQLPAVETATPEEEASPEPSPSPAETAAAAPATTPVPTAALNDGPIATGGKSKGTGERAIIKMKDGSSVEADAAWEDAQGVWFRRSGLVSFVEKSRVEAITESPQKRASAEAKTP